MTHDCGRSIATIVKEIDELKAIVERVRVVEASLHDTDAEFAALVAAIGYPRAEVLYQTKQVLAEHLRKALEPGS